MFRRFHAPEGTAPGQPAPAPAAAPAAPDIAALVAEAVKAQVGPLLEKVSALEGEKAQAAAALAKAEAEKAGTVAAKASAEEQIAQLRKQFGEEKSRSTLGLAVDRYQYASPMHREAALTNFRALCPISVNDAGEVVAVMGGKPKSVPAAFDEWFAASGAIYKAAAAQPGPGQPQPASVENGAPRKSFREMTDAEFAAARAQGVKGTLTQGHGAPIVELKTAVNPYAAKRAQLMGNVKR